MYDLGLNPGQRGLSGCLDESSGVPASPESRPRPDFTARYHCASNRHRTCSWRSNHFSWFRNFVHFQKYSTLNSIELNVQRSEYLARGCFYWSHRKWLWYHHQDIILFWKDQKQLLHYLFGSLETTVAPIQGPHQGFLPGPTPTSRSLTGTLWHRSLVLLSRPFLEQLDPAAGVSRFQNKILFPSKRVYALHWHEKS